MHDTAVEIGEKFLSLYVQSETKVVVELGSLDVNGSLRGRCPSTAAYIGADMCAGRGVDVVIAPKRSLPFGNDVADVVLTSSQMEHDPRFWQTFLELARILKPGGALYMSAPSNGPFHRYPLDLWRFYPDAGAALADWARDNGHPIKLIECFIAERKADTWNDFVAIFIKEPVSSHSSTRFLSDLVRCTNSTRYGEENLSNIREVTEDMLIIQNSSNEVAALRQRVAVLEARMLSIASVASEID